MELYELTAHELLDQIKNNATTPRDIQQSLKEQIERVDQKVHAYVRLFADGLNAIPDPQNACPIPIAIKDNMCVSGQETTCASTILAGFVPPYDATVIQRIKTQGCPLIGHVNMDEFAFGSSTETSCYGPTSNPWNLECVPGGSSGGSAAVVASSESVWAIGSDTGGSIRQPAALCGIVGMKPTYGRVSRYGLIAFASSLDQIGPLTKDVRDSALLLNIIAGPDPMDSTCIDRPVPDYTQSLVNDVRGLKIGIPKEYFIEGMQPDVKARVLDAIKLLKKQGAEFVDITLPHTEYAVATYYIIGTAEASSNLARYDGVQYGLRKQPDHLRKSTLVDMYEETRSRGFGKEAKRRVMLGAYSLSAGYYDAYYLKGLKVRTLIKQDFDKAFDIVDAIITPTSPTTAFKIGEKIDDPLAMYLSDIYTISANLAGIPAISIPCGFGNDGLPVGLQIMTKPFDEEMMFRVAYAYEQNTEWHKQRVQL
ncbi:MAG: Asp-tRNA(Asn)/Glu-tRNA(Gln) amidotransferase subunit GatA [Candidatus Omnitrophica bacterium]|nr:Asp-tRNA(Asn)/Glu-tRNA(Gln) amidotransferase subunit GatA [Candidatus Omnitrophota bacterium]